MKHFAALFVSFVVMLFVTLFACPGTWALTPDEKLADPALESRARDLYREIRCLVCQNETIESSNADLAKDLRAIVRDKLESGASDADILEYLTHRYGDYVRMTPPLNTGTLVLWISPAVMLIIGGGLIAYFIKRQSGSLPPPFPLNEDERKQVEDLMRDGEQ